MRTLYLANTHIESELASSAIYPLEKAMMANQRLIQLQYLPLLYAQEDSLIAVSHFPTPDYIDAISQFNLWKCLPRFVALDEKHFGKDIEVDSWGSSLQVARWAKKRGLLYEMPPFEVVKKINSKAFAYENSPKLLHSCLVYDKESAFVALKNRYSKVVLKTCFGVSGRGHFFVDTVKDYDEKALIRFLEEEFRNGRPVILEPWVLRVLDFSTQWQISKEREVIYLGATKIENNAYGGYVGTIVGDEQKVFGSFLTYVQEHKVVAKKLLKHVASLGYFGFIGLDAMVYRTSDLEDTLSLQPIVEMNARRTLGLVALQFQQKVFSDRLLFLKFGHFTREKSSLIPSKVCKNHQEIAFPRAFFFDFL